MSSDPRAPRPCRPRSRAGARPPLRPPRARARSPQRARRRASGRSAGGLAQRLRQPPRTPRTARHVTVTVGYQSKTINTVTAGTLLRSLGYFERELRAQGKRDGKTYKVKWQDYATGAPITAQMVAGKVDIGSMGDFPLLINAARGKQLNAPTRLVSVTGYNLRGALNTIVTKPGSRLRSLADLRGRNGLQQRRLGFRRHSRTGPPAGRDRSGSGHPQAQPAAGRGRLGAPVGQRRRPLPVRGLAGAARLPGQGEGTVRRGRARSADLPRGDRPRAFRRRSARPWCGRSSPRSRRRPASADATPSPPRSRSRRPPGCRPRWSTSTTAPAASPPSTRHSNRVWSPR